MEKTVVIVPAAGAGKRMGLGRNKAFALLKGVPLLVHCLAMLARTELVAQVIVVVASGEEEEAGALLAQYRQEFFPRLTYELCAGGRERQDSVMNALALVPEDAEYIAVHDGARPFAGKAVFARTLAAAREHGAAIAAVPVKDTIKVVDAQGSVVATPERATLVAVQTPQIFRAELLRRAYAHLAAAPTAVTDDASVVELLGQKVVIAMGHYENIKLTTPEDLLLAESLLEQEE